MNEERPIAEEYPRLAEAIQQMNAALNLVRTAAHLLSVDGRLPGSLDIALHALYQLNRADDELKAQLRALRQ